MGGAWSMDEEGQMIYFASEENAIEYCHHIELKHAFSELSKEKETLEKEIARLKKEKE